MGSKTTLSYDVVMATRNRPDAVALSLPLILRQTRSPARIVLVDSSDDPAPIEALARQAAEAGICPVDHLTSTPGLTVQRNLGLRASGSDIVVFPDDDSLLYPDAVERILEIYEADAERRVAAVCAAPAAVPPSGTLTDLKSHAAEATGPVRRFVFGIRQRAKERLSNANPFLVIGNRLNARHDLPEGVARLEAGPVPYMTGFRMSFRREAIASGFDEALQKYSWFEDIDASFTAMRQGLVVVAARALIYHHRTAAARDNGHRMGLWAILNRGYVVMKHVRANPTLFPDPGREGRRLSTYCRARALAYRAMARGRFGRDRAKGAAEGIRRLPALISAPADRLPETYRELEAGRSAS
jgi:glycosyltransferase involved in cell wall biosynthesis